MRTLSCAGRLAAGIGNKYIKKYETMHLQFTHGRFVN
jgi:hypothetical protein